VGGFATGLATASIGAAILDNDRNRAPILNSITAFCGMTAGSLGGAILVTYAPDPRQLVYVVLLALSVVGAFILWFMPETAELRAGAIPSLRPPRQCPCSGEPSDGAGHAGDYRNLDARRLLILADANAGTCGDRRDLRWLVALSSAR
jgi:MFS family permease